MTTDGQQMCECAYCNRVGTVYVRSSLAEDGTVTGFVCLGGMTLPSGRLRALCDRCTRSANAAFSRRAKIGPSPERKARA
jgi:hypothetical protein